MRSGITILLALQSLAWLAVCEQDVDIDWEGLYGAKREVLESCTADGGEGCITAGEFNYQPTLFGEASGFVEARPSDEGKLPAHLDAVGVPADAIHDSRKRRERQPSPDDLYNTAAAEALHNAVAGPLDHFVSGTSEMLTEADGLQFARTFARRRKGWDHHMLLHAAMAADARVTAQEVFGLLPGREAPMGLALGDAAGRLLVFAAASGELLADFDTGGGEVTALAAFASWRGATTLVSGHADGRVRTHTIDVRLAARRLADETGGAAESDAAAAPATAAPEVTAVHPHQLNLAPSQRDGPAAKDSTAGGEAVRHLLTLKGGREWRLAAIQQHAGISVWREDGLRLQEAAVGAPVLAARWSEASITMLTPSGGAVLLTHATPAPQQPVVRLRGCRGLGEGGEALVAAAFDVRQPVRVYGATAEGRLLQLSLGNAKTFQGCQVMRSRQLGVGPPATLAQGVTLLPLQGHLVAASAARVAVFDVSRPAAGLRRLLEDGTGVIAASLRMQAPLERAPLLAAGRRGPVAFGVGSGVVATYDPAGLRFEHEPDFSWFESWSRPLMTGVTLLVVAFQIARARRRRRQRREAAQVEFDGFEGALGGARLRAALGLRAGAGTGVSTAGRLPGDAPLPRHADVHFGDGAGELDADDDFGDDLGSEELEEMNAQFQARMRQRRMERADFTAAEQ